MRCIVVHTLKVKGKRVLPGAGVTLAAKEAADLIAIGHVIEETPETKATLAQLEAQEGGAASSESEAPAADPPAATETQE